MRIENFIRLIGGELQNNPLINSYERIILNVKKILRGDVFISNDIDEIKQALKNGAYGIVYYLSKIEFEILAKDNFNYAIVYGDYKKFELFQNITNKHISKKLW